MARKQHINTFEGGIDQDTDKSLVANNRFNTADHFTITKNGNTGVLTSNNGFFGVSGENINGSGLNNQVYLLRLKEDVISGNRLFSYNTSAVDYDLLATSDVTSAVELKTQLDTQFGVNINVYVFLDEVYIEFFDDTTITATGQLKTNGYLAVDSAITTSDALFDYTNGITTPTWLAPNNINNVTELQTAMDAAFTLTYSIIVSSLGVDYLYFELAGYHVENINATYLSTLPATDLILTIEEKLILKDDIGVNNIFTFLGVKEIYLNEDERLIFLFKRDDNDAFYVQVIFYNETTRSGSKSGYISKLNTSSGQIISDNIIYNKRSNTNHSLYWCEGTTADKAINFSISIDPNDYVDWDTYVEALKLEVFKQSRYNFEQTKNDFLPEPIFNSLYPISSDTIGLKTGEAVICLYRLKNSGNTSNVSVLSDAIYVTSTLMPLNTTRFPYYEAQGVMYPNESRFGIKFDITDIQSIFYDQIEPFYIHYNQGVTGFKVFQGETKELSENIQLVYNEDYDNSSLSEVTLGSLLSPQNLNNIALTQTVFKNRRIKANTKSSINEVLENFDARAYRFDATQLSKLYDTAGNLINTLDASAGAPTFSDVATRADAINKFNDEYTDFADWTSNQQYQYQIDGDTIGGTGPNISYRIVLGGGENLRFANSTDVYNPNTSSPDDQAYFSMTRTEEGYRGNDGAIFMPGEVYRMFFYIWKGDTPTLAKWIGDIKFPEEARYNYDSLGTSSSTDIKNLQTRGYSIQFFIDTSSIKDEATAFSIGIVPRTDDDKTVIFNSPNLGIHAQDISGDNDVYFQAETATAIGKPTNAGGVPTDFGDIEKVIAFPFSLKKSKMWSLFGDTDYFIKPIQRMGNAHFYESGTLARQNVHIPWTNSSSAVATKELIAVNFIEELDDSLVLNDYIEGLTNTVNILNKSLGGATIIETDVGNDLSKTVMILEDTITDYDSGQAQLCLSLRRVVANQYGGAGYISRRGNDVVLKSYTKIDGKSNFDYLEVQGDTYNCMTDLRIQSGIDVGPFDVYRGVVWPVESHINIHRLDTAIIESEVEVEGQKRFFPTTGVTYEDAQDNDRLNQIDDAFLAQSLTASVSEFSNENTNLILISEKKIEGVVDNAWETFPVNNEKIIDPNLGDVMNLLRYEDRLIVFQERGIAQQYIDQVQQQIDDISQISLGTGDVAGQHIYILRDIGIQSPEQAIEIDGDIIFRDGLRSKIFTIKQGEIPGLSVLLDEDNYNGLVRNLLYDKETNIVFIPNYVDYVASSDSYLIIYDNNLKVFTSTHSYIADDGELLRFSGLTNLISLDNSKMKVYNTSNYLSFPGGTLIPKLEFIVNPEVYNVKVFDNLVLNFEANTFDGNNDPVDDFDYMPESITCETEYQTTGVIPLTTTNYKRKGRYWRYTIPRSTATEVGGTTAARMRGRWMKITIIWPVEAGGRGLTLTNVVTLYRDTNLK